MIEVSKTIFGKGYRFVTTDKLEEALIESLGNYPDCGDGAIDVEVFIGSQARGEEKLISNNPGIFWKYQNSYVTDFGPASVHWILSQAPRLTVNVCIPERRPISHFLSRLRSMEYATKTETFEQTLHELVLIPSVYFFGDLIPIHASAISVSGDGILLAGTGGIGKTSAMLALRDEGAASFLSDDIVIVSSSGYVYPNLAWPKIYAYNLNGTDLKSKLLANRGLVDKIHFDLRAKVNPSGVRRKIRPESLYKSVEKSGCKLASVFYLFRENVTKLAVEQLDAATACEMSIAVMETEYETFHKFLRWDRFNSLASKSSVLLDLGEVLERWQRNLKPIFERVSVKLIRIPMNMTYKGYLDAVKTIVFEQAEGSS